MPDLDDLVASARTDAGRTVSAMPAEDPIHISAVCDPDELDRLVAERFIAAKPHPSGELIIYNYTAAAQYERCWTPETTACRGLITNRGGLVVARPFIKFFGLGDPMAPELPETTFDVFDKLDGSLGVLYEAPDGWAIATRGSFSSDQAIFATRLLRGRYGDFEPPAGTTCLFEIIYPENRIVVNYGDKADLVLLAAIDTRTGADVALPENWPGEVARRYDGMADMGQLVELALSSPEEYSNSEGFVIRFAAPSGTPNVRVKVKFAEYMRLHRIITGVSSRTVWEYLRDGRPLDALLDRVPDEFYGWVRTTVSDLQSRYDEIITECEQILTDPRVERDRSDPAARKRTAEFLLTQPRSSLCFALLDGKDPGRSIWPEIKPEPFNPWSDRDDS